MLKTLSAALIAASMIAAPAFAATVKSTATNPLNAHARLMTPVVKAKAGVKKVHFRVHHHRYHHRHMHRA